MRRKRRNPNIPYIVLILVLAVILVALLVAMEDILGTVTQPTSGESTPSSSTPGSSTPSSSVVTDLIAPQIVGAKDLEVYVGGTVSYKSGVSVTDDIDAKPALKIDNSKVDLNTPGIYEVTYTAIDASGNSTSVTVKLTVKAKPAGFVEPEVIYAKADAILAQFITDDMTDREKAEAVYVWTRRSVHLTYGSAPKGFVHEEADWLQTAYQLINRDVVKGDCYFFFAAQKLLLQRLNIPTIDCEKIYDGDSRHCWSV